MLSSQLLLPFTAVDPALVAGRRTKGSTVTAHISRPSAILHEHYLVTRRRASLAAGRPGGVGFSSCWASPTENAIESSSLFTASTAGVDYTSCEKLALIDQNVGRSLTLHAQEVSLSRSARSLGLDLARVRGIKCERYESDLLRVSIKMVGVSIACYVRPAPPLGLFWRETERSARPLLQVLEQNNYQVRPATLLR